MSNLNQISKLLSKKEIIAVLVFFSIYLIIGINIYNDYGVHSDAYTNQRAGERWTNYIKESLDTGYLLNHKTDLSKNFSRLIIVPDTEPKTVMIGMYDLIHGPVIEIPIYLLTGGVFGFYDLRNDQYNIIPIRHLAIFIIFFSSVLIFYLLCKRLFISWKYGILGCLFLVLHPRIFAHSFYNTIDIPFLSFYLICTYTLITFLDKKTYVTALLHALACAILIDIRIAGLIFPLCTFIFFSFDFYLSKNKNKLLKTGATYSICLLFFIYLFWPYLWNDPLNNFLASYKYSKYTKSPAPWFYNPLWISITTPYLYTLLFLIGSVYLIFSSFIKRSYCYHKNFLLITLLFVLPIIMPIIYGSRLFSGWRHHYFIYPIFVIFMLLGIKALMHFSSKYLFKYNSYILRNSVISVIIFGLIHAAYSIHELHPYQYAYANTLAGNNKYLARYKCTLDYWGLSTNQMLEYILNNDDRKEIKIYYDEKHVRKNLSHFNQGDAKRIKLVNNLKTADYHLSIFRDNKYKKYLPSVDDCTYEVDKTKKIFYLIEFGGVNIGVVYKIKNS